MPVLLRPYLFPLLLFVGALWPAGASANTSKPSAAPLVIWMTPNFPPFHVKNSVGEPVGIADQHLHTLIQQIPGYTHTVETANYRRIVRQIMVRDDVCAPGLVKTPERLGKMVFSQPLMSFRPPQLVIRSGESSRLEDFWQQDGRLKLERLIQSGRFNFGVASGRSYSSEIHGILARQQEEDGLITHYGEDQTQGLARLLVNPRHVIDGLLAFPEEVAYFKANGLFGEDEVEMIPLVMSGWTDTMYAACSKSEVGKRIIQEINRVLTDKGPDYFYQRYKDAFADPFIIQADTPARSDF
ncbi:transporter substrate-binding domain-containing protein [Marinobacter caseinilyticus]|uniref:transporter substrate-binding domain-containing protein n=1 Tax=Marinobacter caseinilyticus TaxID=2692195 RepID=UPI00140AC407|nr:hypothetical protein [Marinobacter caseinilyticus]